MPRLMRLTILLLVVLVSARGGHAQVVAPVGVTRDATQPASLIDGHSPMPVLSLSADDARSPLWQWALVGAVAGAAIGGAAAAHSASRSGDEFFPQLTIGYGIGIGALGGAAVGMVLGAIYNGVVHGDSKD